MTGSHDKTRRERTSKLLIVEDDQSQLRTLTAIMEAEGFDVVGCSDASETIEHLRRASVGVAILDLHLSDLTDTELLDVVGPYFQDVKFIIHTAYGSYDTAREALYLGACAYVEKGGDPNELIGHVRNAFNAR